MMKTIVMIALVVALALGGVASAQQIEPTPFPREEYEAYVDDLGLDDSGEFVNEAMVLLFELNRLVSVQHLEVDAVISGEVDLKRVRALQRQLEDLEEIMDELEDMLESSLHAGDFDRATYQVLEDELERQDDELEEQDERLEEYWDD
jgi:DNA-binding transcriptional MerR regulator